MNRGVKHGFLDMNQAAPIPKDVLNAALAPNPNAVIRTPAQADATRPITPGPNGFRRMDLLTNEGRSWYQGVRIAFAHRTTPLILTASYTRSKSEDRLNHWFSPENSADPELDRGPDRRRHAAQPRDQLHLESARLRCVPQRLASQHGVAPSEREPIYDPLRGRPDRRWLGWRLQQPRLPVQPARRTQHRPRRLHQLRGSHAGRHVRRRERQDRDSAPTCSICSTTRTCSPAATSTSSAIRGSASTRAGLTSSTAASSSSRRRIDSRIKVRSRDSSDQAFRSSRRIGTTSLLICGSAVGSEDRPLQRDTCQTIDLCRRGLYSSSPRSAASPSRRANRCACACRPSSATSSSRSIRRRRR